MVVRIDEETAIEMLVERVKFWTDDSDVIDLYEKMYNNYIYSGVFEGAEFDVKVIVDNDYINYTRIITRYDEEFTDLLQVYKENGIGDCSCETEICDFIESVDSEKKPTMFLVR